MTVQTQFDLEAFKRAVAASNEEPEAQLEFLHEEIEWIEIDQRTPPSSPAVLRGRDAVCGDAARRHGARDQDDRP